VIPIQGVPEAPKKLACRRASGGATGIRHSVGAFTGVLTEVQRPLAEKFIEKPRLRSRIKLGNAGFVRPKGGDCRS